MQVAGVYTLLDQYVAVARVPCGSTLRLLANGVLVRMGAWKLKTATVRKPTCPAGPRPPAAARCEISNLLRTPPPRPPAK